MELFETRTDITSTVTPEFGHLWSCLRRQGLREEHGFPNVFLGKVDLIFCAKAAHLLCDFVCRMSFSLKLDHDLSHDLILISKSLRVRSSWVTPPSKHPAHEWWHNTWPCDISTCNSCRRTEGCIPVCIRQTVHVAVHLTTFVTGECASLTILAFLVSRCISTWLAVDEEQSGKTQTGKI